MSQSDLRKRTRRSQLRVDPTVSGSLPVTTVAQVHRQTNAPERDVPLVRHYREAVPGPFDGGVRQQGRSRTPGTAMKPSLLNCWSKRRSSRPTCWADLMDEANQSTSNTA